MMRSQEIAAELSRLVYLEGDEVAAYDAALALLPAGPVRDELALFQADHRNHAHALQDLFARLQVDAPERRRPDVKGVVIGALTAPRPPASASELLTAIRGNEQLSGSLYAKALARPFPVVVVELLRRAREEERRHLEWVERTLSRLGPWPAGAPHP